MAKKKKKSSAPTVQVDIVSDVVCPWCWLGSRYFLEAVKKSGRKVELSWRPYMLDPTVPAEGVEYKAYMKSKFGGGPSDRFKAMRTHLEEAAPDAGITFRFSEITRRPNTLRAHRLLRWAEGQGMGSEMAERLFKACFDDVRDIGDIAVLTELAGELGMDTELVSDLLNSDEDEQAVLEEIDFFRGLGVSGVPCFIYNGQFAVQGAQPVEAHLKAIQQAAALPPAV